MTVRTRVGKVGAGSPRMGESGRGTGLGSSSNLCSASGKFSFLKFKNEILYQIQKPVFNLLCYCDNRFRHSANHKLLPDIHLTNYRGRHSANHTLLPDIHLQ